MGTYIYIYTVYIMLTVFVLIVFFVFAVSSDLFFIRPYYLRFLEKVLV